MPRKPGAAAPDLAELAAEVARLRKRVARLERAPGGGLPARPSAPAKPVRRNAAPIRAAPGLTIEPAEPWGLHPPILRGRGK